MSIMSVSTMSSSPGSSLSSSPKSSFSESSDEFSDERRDSYERVYTKDFLLSLRKCPSALVKPDHLPDLPQIICDEPCMNRKRTDSCPTPSYRSNENQNFNRFPNHFRGRRRYRISSESASFDDRRKASADDRRKARPGEARNSLG